MAKYNITTIKEKKAEYRTRINDETLEEIKTKIIEIILVQKKYRDPNYSARMLADEIGTNTRYVSATLEVKFQMNYNALVNRFRINDAMSMLTSKKFYEMSMEDIAYSVGYNNRQTFYASFYKFVGKTPREYRENYYAANPDRRPKKK